VDFVTIPPKEIVEKTAVALIEHGIKVVIVEKKEHALEKIKELIPAGASVMNGASQTLEQIGFVEYLKSGRHPWKNLHLPILAEQDPTKQMKLRRQSVFAQYFLGSIQAVTEDGQVLVASATGSQIAPYAYTASNVVWVASTNKIVPVIEDGLRRIHEYSFPLEDGRMKNVGRPGSMLSKILIFGRESARMGRTITMILVNEKLGF